MGLTKFIEEYDENVRLACLEQHRRISENERISLEPEFIDDRPEWDEFVANIQSGYHVVRTNPIWGQTWDYIKAYPSRVRRGEVWQNTKTNVVQAATDLRDSDWGIICGYFWAWLKKKLRLTRRSKYILG